MTEITSKPPFSLVGIDHVVLLVSDLDRAMRFYRQVLGRQPGYSYPPSAWSRSGAAAR